MDVLRNNIDVDGDGDYAMEIREEKNYYPFGLTHKGYNNFIVGRKHNYGFVGKEENDELGLEWLDFGARNYDASIGRWMNLDPMSEKFYGWTPYKYSLNNPILFMDPDGNCETCVKALKKYYGGIWNGFKNTLSTAGSAIKQAANDPIGTVKAMASDHLDRVTNPVRLLKDTKDVVTQVNPVAAIIDDGMTAATSEDPISSVGNQQGERLANQAMTVAGEGVGAATAKAVSAVAKATSKTKLYRAVSDAELADIGENGVQVNPDGSNYQTGKLFATTAEDAAQFGKNNFPWDGEPNTVIEVKVSNKVMKTATKFTADQMPAVSIPANQLKNIKDIIPLKSSAIPQY